ncbi:MAG: hypothetical protein Ta2G_05340 [Termitinemataceae bacterium]|nr:MAG: hypothetical protein Ta2G_05340 [Termitinemataceae bacterium]
MILPSYSYLLRSGSDECVEFLLECGADIHAKDRYNRNVLMGASAECSKRIVRLLLESGAIQGINDQDTSGHTALMEAAIKGKAENLKYLLDNGANLNLSTHIGTHFFANTDWYLYFASDRSDGEGGGQTALMMASNSECIQILLDAGANVNTYDKAGRNALLFQCLFYRNEQSVKQLISAGSHLYKNLNDGKLLPYLASIYSDYDRNPQIIEMLINAGCTDVEESEVYGDRENFAYYFTPDRR